MHFSAGADAKGRAAKQKAGPQPGDYWLCHLQGASKSRDMSLKVKLGYLFNVLNVIVHFLFAGARRGTYVSTLAVRSASDSRVLLLLLLLWFNV